MHGAPANGEFLRSDNLMMSLKFTVVGGPNPTRVSPIYPYFTPNWHLHNAFSMEL